MKLSQRPKYLLSFDFLSRESKKRADPSVPVSCAGDRGNSRLPENGDIIGSGRGEIIANCR